MFGHFQLPILRTSRLALLLVPAAFLVAFGILAPDHLAAQTRPVAALTPGIIDTLSGNGGVGFSGDGGPATLAQLDNPFDVVSDPAGNVYVADESNQVVRKIDLSGKISTIAGTPSVCGHSGDNGPATKAQLCNPLGLALDTAGNLYIADYGYSYIRKVDSSGTITSVAGNGNSAYSGDNGPATSAALFSPYKITTDVAGNLFIADTWNNVVRRVDHMTQIITTVAGDGFGAGFGDCSTSSTPYGGYAGDHGAAIGARLFGPRGLAVDPAGNLYIADSCNQVIRRVDAGTGTITTVAGNGFGANPGDGTSPTSTGGAFSGDNGPATAAKLAFPEGVALDAAGQLYIADSLNQRVRKVDLSGTITSLAGTGTPGFSGDGGVATGADMQHIQGITLDRAGNFYLTERVNSRVRKVDVSASALTFPTPTIAGTTDAADEPLSVLLTNAGTGSLTPASFGIGIPVDFTRSLNGSDSSSECGAGYDLAPGASCTITVQFAPAAGAEGSISSSASVLDNSLNATAASQSIALYGMVANTAKLYLVSGTHQTATIGTPFAEPLVVKALDKNNTPLAGVTINFDDIGTQNTAFLSSNSVVTGSDGMASVAARAGSQAGGYTPTARSPGVSNKVEFLLINDKGEGSIDFNHTTRTYTGYPLGVFATTTPPGLSVGFTYDGNKLAPTHVGTYTVVATINDRNYQGSSTTTLHILPRP